MSKKRTYTPILLLTYFAILTGVVFWSLRLSTIHYGKASFQDGAAAAKVWLEQHKTEFCSQPTSYDATEGMTLAESANTDNIRYPRALPAPSRAQVPEGN